MIKKYLALGDSYTIGELVAYSDNFPSQFVSMANEKGMNIDLSDLIAVTGWTTDELSAAIAKKQPKFDHDMVSLLIGANNQYRNRSTEEYEWQFYSLLCQAILFAKSNAANVVVLSIPDWGLTPFNKDKDPIQISKEIDEFNSINKRIAESLGCKYIDITESTRDHAKNTIYLAEDLLHYSGTEYQIWAKKMLEVMTS